MISTETLIEQAAQKHQLTRAELEAILADEQANDRLFAAADEVRHRFVGDEVHLRGLVEFSNICRQNCCYCGLRRDNHAIKRFRLTPDEIFTMAQKAVEYGYRTIVMQSGEDEWFTVERMI